MNPVNIWLTISIFLSVFFWKLALPRSKDSSLTIGKMTVPLLFVLSLALRIVLAGSYTGHGTDIGCFSAWADRMATIGPSAFYSPDYFSDYPPLYLYILAVVGMLRKAFSLTYYSPLHLVLLKLPAILADLGVGYLIYRICNKLVGLRTSICLACLYLLQPVVILNSCIWGQIDSVFTLFLLLTCYYLESQNLLPAMLIFGAGILLKPQMLIFTPIMIVAVFQYIYRGSFSLHMFMKASAYALLTLLMLLLLASPFGLDKVISQYMNTLGSYPYASVNAYNFWAGMGMNWQKQDTIFMGLSASSWGTIVIILATAFSLILGLKLGNLHQKHAVIGAFLIITVFTYSVRMHERYLFPAIPLLLLGFAGFASRQMCRVPSFTREGVSPNALSLTLRIAFPIVFTLLTSLHFYNCAQVLHDFVSSFPDPSSPSLIISGICMVLCSLFFYYILVRLQTKKEFDIAFQPGSIPILKAPIRIGLENYRLTRMDLACILGITLLYAVFALRDLGSTVAPQTVYSMNRYQTITLSLPDGQKAKYIAYYSAPEHNRSIQINSLDTEGDTPQAETKSFQNVFTWQKIELARKTNRLSILAQMNDTNLLEMVLLDEDGIPLMPLEANEYPELFDEQDTYPEAISFRNSMYFDEIYHARTAYEFLHGLRSYENTHPPLGKIFISIGILLFGMNPFGWRIIGTLFGITMLPILHLFAKRLTGDTVCAALTTWIFAFDFMHFAQTRIATIDVYIVFFVLCMYYFLFYFFTLDYGTVPVIKLCLPLCLCGLSMGLGVACKWTGVYSGLGMGILFFGYLYLMYLKQKSFSPVQSSSKSNSTGMKKETPHRFLDFKAKTMKLILSCVVFFVLVPLLIYVASYLPFRDGTGSSLLMRALVNQNTMYSYHSNLHATHYFASPFYEWPIIFRPIWYYSGILSDTMREGISSFGNPLVWWAGIPAFLYMVYLAIRKKDRRALFLIIGYGAQYLPWFFVERLTFIYHYFPSVVFLVLMIGYSFRNLKERLPKKGYYMVLTLYALSVFGLFILFYPVLAGQPVELSFAQHFLKWFKTWVLVAG